MIIFQPEIFHKPETLREFVDELKNSSIPYVIVDDYDFINQSSLKLDSLDKTQNNVVLHTLSLYRNLSKSLNALYPGTTFNFTDYSFSKLSSLVSRNWLFNNDYEIRTMGDLIVNDHFPSYEIFIRPDTGNKAFTGDVFKRDAFLTNFKKNTNDYSKFVITSSPKEINSEFRFHIYKREIVSQAFYTYNEEWRYTDEDYEKAKSFMINFLEAYDICELLNIPFVVLDVAVGSLDKCGLVEHNCFNTSGIYPGSNVKGIISCLQKSLEEYD